MCIWKLLKQCQGLQIAGVTDVYLPLAEARAKEHNIEQCICRIQINCYLTHTIDAVVIAVSNEWHAPIAVQALEAGKHVMLEKPMALISLPQGRLLKQSAKQVKILMIPHQMRWDAPITRCQTAG